VDFKAHEYSHDPNSTSFGLEAAEKLGVDPNRVFKTLIANVDESFAVAIVPVNQQVSLKSLARTLGAKRAVMADPAQAARLTGYVVGGISPLGQKRLLSTVIDQSAKEFETILVSGGRRGFDIELSPQDLADLLSAVFAEIAS
jgi:Cys-tRNA(Pro)/Cys-tRNA(Cys) deacylase